MSTNSINGLSSSYLQSILSSALTSNGVTSNAFAPVTPQSDNGQLSPFAQIASTLQQLQQSNPTQYQQVTQQIAANLQTAAQTATADGNTTAANQLTQLSTDFTNASQSGQLPNIQDLAEAIGGGHHHHHHSHAASNDSDNDSANSTSTTSTPSTSTTSP